METLGASFRLIAPYVPTALVPAETLDRLAAVAAQQPPLHCAGFEVRLSGEDATVDLAQGILGFSADPERWRQYLEAEDMSQASPPWHRLRDFARRWTDPETTLPAEIAGVWLEFDTPTVETATAPSVFTNLMPQRGAADADTLTLIAAELFETLTGKRLSSALTEAVGACATACPPGAGVSDLGFMLGRDVDALRIVIACLEPTDLAPFLERIGASEGSETIAAAEDLLRESDEVTLSLDVIGSPSGPDQDPWDPRFRVLPRIGVEIFPGHLFAELNQWRPRLDDLVVADLCTPEKRDALLSWPGYTEPGQGPWPATLLAESLLGSPTDFSVLGRRLDHIKLVCEPGRPIEAKAYLGFGPLWLTAERPDQGVAAVAVMPGDSGTVRPRPAATAYLDAAGDRAIRFLLDTQSAAASWRDFPTIMGGSDEWVTAYVIEALAGVENDAAHAAACAAWSWLQARRDPADGWGFNEALPIDADGTAWGLLAAQALGEHESPRAVAAREVLERHRVPGGGLASYLPEARPSLAETLGDVDMNALFGPHVCVTAAASGLEFARDSLAPFLIDAQQADGSWRGFWWSDRAYATGLAAAALKRCALPEALAATAAAGRWARSRLAGNGEVMSRATGTPSPFAAAAALPAVLAAATIEATLPAATLESIEPTLRWLLAAQRVDGSWPPSALLRIPPSDAADPRDALTRGFTGRDEEAVFTTATVLRSLEAVRRYEMDFGDESRPSPGESRSSSGDAWASSTAE